MYTIVYYYIYNVHSKNILRNISVLKVFVIYEYLHVICIRLTKIHIHKYIYNYCGDLIQ